MEKKVIDSVIHTIKQRQQSFFDKNEDVFAIFSGKGYTSLKISKNNFNLLKNLEKKENNNKILFIDGGNIELFSSPDISLQFIRVYSTIYQNNKRIKCFTKEYYVLISAEKRTEGLFFVVDMFDKQGNVQKNAFCFDTEDKELTEGSFRLNISSVGNLVRDLFELKEAKRLTEELSSGDVLVRDGILQCNHGFAWPYFQELFSAAVAKNIVVVGFAKTTTLFATNGVSVVANLARLQPQGTWCYQNLVEVSNPMHPAQIYFVKLHEKANYLFRVEVYNKANYDFDKVLSLLLANSCDPIFLGYPYGLVEADKFARVTNQEKEFMKTIFATQSGKLWEEIEQGIRAISAHGVLDKIG